MGFLDRFKKKRLTKEERITLEKAREELRKTKEKREDNDIEEHERFSKKETSSTDLELKQQIEEMDERLEKNLEIQQKQFNEHASELKTKPAETLEKSCNFCQKQLVWPDINSCYYCRKHYCGEHRLAENHECPKVMAAKHIERDYVRKKGVNITTAKFSVICKNCGFTSDYSHIEDVNQIRIDHIHQNNCPSEKVQLRQHEDDKKADDEFIQKTYPTEQGNTWMYGCLEDAKQIILKHHNYEGLEEFFSTAKFGISIQTDHESAYGYIDGTHPYHRIGIHKALEKNSEESYKMVTVVLVHELLHAIHGDWSESKVSSEEKRLANLGFHFDALHNLDLLFLSGKMRLCGK